MNNADRATRQRLLDLHSGTCLCVRSGFNVLFFLMAAFLSVSSDVRPVEIKHYGMTNEDRFFLCARQLLGKPVLFNNATEQYASLPCPADAESLRQALQQAGLSLFEDSHFFYLIASGYFKPVGLTWKHLSISLQARSNFRAPGCRPLTSDEIAQISEAIFRDARMVPVSYLQLSLPQPGSDTATMSLSLIMGACHLKPDVESVFATLQFSRLIYGEMRNHSFEILWDSPLLGGQLVTDLMDVNGDGVREMIVRSGGTTRGDWLDIYDTAGNDLVPQTITAAGISFEKHRDGKVDILVAPYNDSDQTDRYTLVNGLYILPTPTLTSMTPSSVWKGRSGTKLILVGTNFPHGSAVTFSAAGSGQSDAGDTPQIVLIPKWISSSKLLVQLTEDVVFEVGNWRVSVQNTSGKSNDLILKVKQP
jgi:hypothetical protein